MLNFKELQYKADKSLVNSKSNPKIACILYILVIILTVFIDYFIFKMSLISNIIIAVFIIFLTIGFNWFCLKVSRDENPSMKLLLEPFKHPVKVFTLLVIILLLTAACSVLLIIPGIIMAIRFSQAFNIFFDNPKVGILDAIKESYKLMSGRVVEYIKLNLSLLPWVIMVFASGGFITFYVIPYYKITTSYYYNTLCEPSLC